MAIDSRNHSLYLIYMYIYIRIEIIIDLSLIFIQQSKPPAVFKRPARRVFSVHWIAAMWVPGAQVEVQSKLLEEKARGAQEMASELEVGAPGRVAVGLNRENWSFC
jgi:hypothetical protein